MTKDCVSPFTVKEENQSHKYAFSEKGMKQAVRACAFACDFLLFPLISSGLRTRISLAYICTEKRKMTIKNDIDMRFTAIDTSAWEELKKSIEELALCMRNISERSPNFPTCCTTGTCAES